MLHVCPTDVVDAPADRVWQLVATPSELARWSGTVLSEGPQREVRAGDRLVMRAGIGRRLKVTFRIDEAIRPEQLSLHIRLPFGVTNDEIIRIAPLGRRASRVAFN
jgi:uncharacterized protein YndB with AHSA1/START domain